MLNFKIETVQNNESCMYDGYLLFPFILEKYVNLAVNMIIVCFVVIIFFPFCVLFNVY